MPVANRQAFDGLDGAHAGRRNGHPPQHAVKYMFPAVEAGESRGVATAWGAEPLASRIASPPITLDPVWPDAKGRRRGLAVRSLHHPVPEAARRDPRLGERLALVDALRLGDARIRGVAAELLTNCLEQLAE
jgi:hypothetical protein